MKKKKNEGFMLVETLIVSTFIATTMIFIFVQFRRIYTGYQRSFSYNTTEGIYATREINQYILKNGYEKIVDYMSGRTVEGETAKPEPYVELYNETDECSKVYLYETDYCNRLMKNLNVKRVLVTYADLTDFIGKLDSYEELDVHLRNFIKSIKYDTDDIELTRRRTIIEFKDDTYASLKLYQREG